MRVALRGGALGDVLVGIPAWRAMRDALPDVPFVIGVPVAVAALVRASLERVRHAPLTVVGSDDPAFAWVYGDGPPRTSRAVPNWSAVRVAAAWTRAHRQVGPRLRGAGVRSVVAADPFPPTGSRLHVADWLASTLSNVDISVPDGWDAAPWLSVPKEVGAAVGDVPMRPRRVAIVHPGSGSPRKRWPVDRWQAAIRALILDGWSVTVLEGEADGAVVAAVLDGLPPGRVGEVEVARHEGIGVVAGRLATASLVVANDSGIAHLAAGVGAPVVAVFGPTDPATWRPRGPRVAVVGGTPGATWPHASSTLPDVEIAWPEVAEMLLAVKRVAPALPADAPLGPLREGASS